MDLSRQLEIASEQITDEGDDYDLADLMWAAAKILGAGDRDNVRRQVADRLELGLRSADSYTRAELLLRDAYFALGTERTDSGTDG